MGLGNLPACGNRAQLALVVKRHLPLVPSGVGHGDIFSKIHREHPGLTMKHAGNHLDGSESHGTVTYEFGLAEDGELVPSRERKGLRVATSGAL